MEGVAVGCARMLERLRAVRPAVHACGHVHAYQGLRYLEWRVAEPRFSSFFSRWDDAPAKTKSREAKAWREAVRASYRAGTGFVQPPPGAPRPRRVVSGCDLSDVAGAEDVYRAEELRELEADLSRTLFVNAASLNATTPLAQHGVVVTDTNEVVLKEGSAARTFARASACLRERMSLHHSMPELKSSHSLAVRPPIIGAFGGGCDCAVQTCVVSSSHAHVFFHPVRVYPDYRRELVPLGHPRFPEE